MTIQECYAALGGNYDEALTRLMNETLIKKFLLKFLEDNSMSILEDAVSREDYETAFRGAHTLKGVAGNMAFEELRKVASELTEQLRGDKSRIDQDLLAAVRDSYQKTVDAIRQCE